MIAKSRILLLFFITKIILDFFSPFRELNMVIQLCIVLPILMDRLFLKFIIKQKFNLVLLYFLLYVFISRNVQSIKIFAAIIFFCVFAFIGYKSKFETLIIKSKLIYRVGILSFCISLTLSILLGKYSKREFYNFEHVNLLGTYVVFLSIFFLIYYKYNKNLRLNSNPLENSPLIFAIISFLTLSTGSFITQLTVFISPKYYKIKKIVYLSTILLSSIIAGYFVTKSLTPDLHLKIFGTINYFTKETSFMAFYNDSIKQNLDLFNSENSSSFTWRIYSYIFFLHTIFNLDLLHFVFGSGIESYKLFAEFRPHNDFIAILLDFGLFGLLIFIVFLSRVFRLGIRNNFNILKVFIIFLTLRLLFENVIYSFYLFSLISSIGGLLYGSFKIKKI